MLHHIDWRAGARLWHQYKFPADFPQYPNGNSILGVGVSDLCAGKHGKGVFGVSWECDGDYFSIIRSRVLLMERKTDNVDDQRCHQ